MKRGLKQFIIDGAQTGLVASLKLRALRSSGAVTILNFHRVSGGGADYGALTPAVFEEPLAIISFDDGYKDFIDIASPILAKHGVAANQNVVSACIESGRPPMNVELQDFIAAAPAALLREIPLPGLPRGADPDDRAKSCMLVTRALKWLPMARQKEQSPDFWDIYPLNLDSY